MRKNHKKWLTSLVLTFLIIGFFWIISPPHFTETNDDKVMAAISYGYYGDYEEHLLYINVLLGGGLRLLNEFIPFSIPWYSVFHLVTIVLSAWVFVYLCQKRFGIKKSIMIFIPVFLTFGYELFCSLQFSKTAGISVIAGILLMFDSITEHATMQSVLGVFLVFLGSLFRFLVFELLLLFFAPVGFFFLVKFIKKDKSILKRTIVFFSIVGILCFGARIFHKMYYKVEPLWEETLVNNENRAELIDHGFPNYDNNIDLYNKLHITKEDISLYSSSMYGDTSLFTNEAVSELVEAKREEEKKSISLPYFFKNVLYQMAIKYSYFVPFLILISCSLFTLQGDKKKTLLLLIEGIIFIAVQFYFYYRDRYLQNRIDVMICFALASITLLYIMENAFVDVPMKLFGVAALVFAFLQTPSIIDDAVQFEADRKNNPTVLYDLVNTDKEHVYVYFPNFTSLPDKMFEITEREKVGYFDNYVSAGHWKFTTPVVKKIFNERGLWNPYPTMIDNKEANFVCISNSQHDLVLNHMRTHYNAETRSELISIVKGKYRIYRFVSQNLNIEGASEIINNGIVESNIFVKEDNMIYIEGDINIPVHNSFSKDMYIGIMDREGEETIYYATKFENKTIKWSGDKEYNRQIIQEQKDTLFNHFSCKCDYVEDGRVYLYYEDNGIIYKLFIGKVTEKIFA